MNHDQPRAVSRFGDDKEYREISAKMLATFTLTLQGTPYIYDLNYKRKEQEHHPSHR